ncbi:MAG: response regulator [Terriglobales bacterium]
MAGTILLADDNPHARRMGSEYLSDLGYRVVTVPEGTAALAALSEPDLKLVLVDAMLPGMPAAAAGGELGGMELCRRIKEHPAWHSIPVLVMLGALAQVAPAALAGADGILRKPLSSAGLERWLGRTPAGGTPAVASAAELLERAVSAAALAGLRDGA